MTPLIFSVPEWEKLKKATELAYPKEACGVLLGQDEPRGVVVECVALLQNLLEPQNAERLKTLTQAATVTLDELLRSMA